eukprot:CAMPEP_0168449628 /NCGR_PEP_ID=MMETSP0228-20121227/47698_1 /TAXON_ID=133427 /ORGANISM="Protoceratium reticulatum, Strain CCCM 535 (=CCMP 1889)" /LENGTH=112 /DNA_ID=CAMNT_0008464179 /DNA_START=161 /DNA_END=496 /DNA_ORIENTATION=+
MADVLARAAMRRSRHGQPGWRVLVNIIPARGLEGQKTTSAPCDARSAPKPASRAVVHVDARMYSLALEGQDCSQMAESSPRPEGWAKGSGASGLGLEARTDPEVAAVGSEPL